VKDLLDLGVSRDKILVLPFGINTQIFRPDESKKLDNLVLFVGRLDQIKGLHILLKSLSYLSIKTQVAIIGPKKDTKYFKEIKKMCDEINEKGSHSVNYLGNMEQKDIVPWYQKAAVLVRADVLSVSGGNTAMEALACGTPVIGTGNLVVRHNVNGIIIPPNDPKKLAKALQELLSDKKLRERYGREGRRIIELDFCSEKLTLALIKIYERMLTINNTRLH